MSQVKSLVSAAAKKFAAWPSGLKVFCALFAAVLLCAFLVGTGYVLCLRSHDVYSVDVSNDKFSVKFALKPGFDEPMQRIVEMNLRRYLETLSVCLAEPDNENKFWSLVFLGELINTHHLLKGLLLHKEDGKKEDKLSVPQLSKPGFAL